MINLEIVLWGESFFIKMNYVAEKYRDQHEVKYQKLLNPKKLRLYKNDLIEKAFIDVTKDFCRGVEEDQEEKRQAKAAYEFLWGTK